ncbi:mitochondrial amidoxime reducing component 2-like [Argonauta hians]
MADNLEDKIWQLLITLSKDESARVMTSLIAGSFLKHCVSVWFHRMRQNYFVTVGRVAAIFCYPVKSCRWLSVEKAWCTQLGISYKSVGDRQWMFVNSSNTFLSQRQEPKMSLITPNVDNDENFLQLDAPEMEPLILPKILDQFSQNILSCSVWGNQIKGLDCGDVAAKWICRYLQKDGYRMVYSGDNLEKRNVIPKQYSAVQNAQCVYQDSSPYHLLSQASIDNINSRIDKEVNVHNFRPNILVEGCMAFDEDSWDEIKIGSEVTFHYIEPCTRCLLTTVDPDQGEKDPQMEPLKMLRKFRTPPGTKSPNFGIMISPSSNGWIQVGDPVYAFRK